MNRTVVLLLGTVLRFVYFIKPRSFWGDEWFTIFLSRNGSLVNVVKESFKDVHPPMQFILYHFGGYRLIPFIVSILCIYFFSKLTKDRITLFLFAISPYFIHLSGETRGYGLLCLFAILVLCGYKWAFPLALFTEHYAWFLLLVIPFAVWMIPFLAGSGILIGFQTATEQVFIADRGFAYNILSIVKKLGGLFVQFGGGVQCSFLTTDQAIALVRKGYVWLYTLPLIFVFFARNKKYLKLLIAPILFLFIFYPIRLNARYLPFVGVAYFLLIGEGYRKIPYRRVAQFIMILFVAIQLYSLGIMYIIRYDPYHREDYITASEYVSAKIAPEDGLVGCYQYYEHYTGQVTQRDGNTIWEICVTNPDMEVNNKHWLYQESNFNKIITLKKQISDLVWVVKYENKI